MKYLLFDTETTSLLRPGAANKESQPRIVEFYGVLCDEEGNELREVDHLIYPGGPLSEETTKITGLRDADLKGKPTFADVADEISELIGESRAVVAHNLSFDYMVVSIELERIGLKAPWPLIRICTVEQTEHLKGHRLKLMDLHTELFGEGFPTAHRARNDVQATKRCFFHLLKEGVI